MSEPTRRPVTAIVVRNNGRLVSRLVLAAIVGWLRAAHGYDAELVDIDANTPVVDGAQGRAA